MRERLLNSSKKILKIEALEIIKDDLVTKTLLKISLEWYAMLTCDTLTFLHDYIIHLLTNYWTIDYFH